MKELSIEEKAKRYDEAIKKLRDFYRDYDTVSCLIDVKEELANLFPELKESEDERIRNFLIDFIKVCGWTEKKDQGWPLREDCIAWLEKQGEKKLLNNEQYQTIPVETLDRLYAAEKELSQLKQKVEPKFKVGDKIWHKTYKGECIHHIIKIENDNYIGDDNTSISISTADKEYELVEKQGEQETVVVIPKFRVGDVIRPKGSMAEYTIESISGECYHGKGWGLNISSDDDYELVEQKSSWNKKDENMLQSVLWHVSNSVSNGKSQDFRCDITEWLKSLRPQNRWKPSDEQMETLKQAISAFPYETDYLELLYDDLKKLRD